MSKLYEAVNEAFDNNKIVESEVETIYDTNLSNYDYLKNNMSADDLDVLVKSIAASVLDYDRSDEIATLGADFKFTDAEIQKGIEELNNLDGDKIAVYCYREFVTKYNSLFGIEEGRGWDFKESANLNEERYYYGEVERIKDKIESAGALLVDAHDMVEEVLNDSSNEYSDDQKAFLNKVFKALDDDVTELMGMHSDLADTFKNRIRALTPDEKEAINQMKKEGKL